MVDRHKYFKGLDCPLCIIDPNTQTENSSETEVRFCHTKCLKTPEYSNPEAIQSSRKHEINFTPIYIFRVPKNT